MAIRGQTIEADILPSAIERFLRQIHVYRFRPDFGGHGRKRTGVGKTVQDLFRARFADKLPVLALIDKESDRVSGAKIDPELQMIFPCDGLQTLVYVSGKQLRRLALLIFLRQNASKDAF